MSRTYWTIVFPACMLALVPASGAAQQSTRDGVYTAAQAARGRDVYSAMCRACHNSPTHTPAFKATWHGRPLAELYEFITWDMPKDNPGTLTPGENIVVLAYMLEMLGMPAGNHELPADPAALGRITFDTLATATGETKP
jgi:hypothetical protein